MAIASKGWVIDLLNKVFKKHNKNLFGSDEYDELKSYNPGDCCIDKNQLYKNKVACIEVKPSDDDGTYWEKVTISQMLTNFQDGVDTIYNSLVNRGATPDVSTPTELAKWITGGWMDDNKTKYSSGLFPVSLCALWGSSKSTTASTVTAVGRLSGAGWSASESNGCTDARGYVWLGPPGYIRMYLVPLSGRVSSTNCTTTIYGCSSSNGNWSSAVSRGNVSTSAGNTGVRSAGSWVGGDSSPTYIPCQKGDIVYMDLKSSNSSAAAFGLMVVVWTKNKPN